MTTRHALWRVEKCIGMPDVNRTATKAGCFDLSQPCLYDHSFPDHSFPFCDLHLKVALRQYPCRWKCTQVIPIEPRSIGEHLKRRRLELHLFQTDLAKIFGVDEATIRNWEKNTYQPGKQHMPAIAKWLGYDPRKAVAGRAPSCDCGR